MHGFDSAGSGVEMSNQFVTVSVKCAECGKVRGESNHWFVLDVSLSPGFVVYSVARLDSLKPPTEPELFPACGEGCLQKLESKILSGKKL